jgi:hypothetical protein
VTAKTLLPGLCSLAKLFRGNRTPPPDMDHYPEEYVPYFHLIENHVLTICEAMVDRTDQKMEDIYTALLKRPDGRSLGALMTCCGKLRWHARLEARGGQARCC